MKTTEDSGGLPDKYHFNGLTRFKRNNKPCVTKSKRGPSKVPPTEKQIESRKTLSTMTGFTTNFFTRHPVLKLAWKTHGQQTWSTSLDAFKRANYLVFDPKLNGVEYFPDFLFSEGDLVAPREVRVTRDGWQFTIRWDVPRRNYPRCDRDHMLAVGYFHESRPDAPQIVLTPFTRGDRVAIIDLPDNAHPLTEGVHLYPFFIERYYQAFSKSRHAWCEGEREEI